MKRPLILTLWLAASFAWAGPYSGGTGGDSAIDEPIAGFVDGGSTLNPVFKGWATRVVDYSPANPGTIDVAWGDPTKALGAVTGEHFDVVSLGELTKAQIASGVAPGSITMGFNMKITNGAGYDFAVFENAFPRSYEIEKDVFLDLVFMELAYVEVSTDGVHFARFPSTSLNPEKPQDFDSADWDDTPAIAMANGGRDATNVHNLAGKHINNGGDSWGTGFDLSDLLLNELVLAGLVDLNDINFIRIVDIPGTGDYLDANGNPIYDAWWTYGSGGFDLEAIGIINGVPIPEPSALCGLLLVGAFAMARRRR